MLYIGYKLSISNGQGAERGGTEGPKLDGVAEGWMWETGVAQ